MTANIFGHMEIDCERGVIYFHSSIAAMEAGFCPTPLRICGIGEIKFPMDDRQIDITIHPAEDGELIAKVQK